MITRDEAALQDHALRNIPLWPLVIGLPLAVTAAMILGIASGVGAFWVGNPKGSHLSLVASQEIGTFVGLVLQSLLLVWLAHRSLRRAGLCLADRFRVRVDGRWCALALLLGAATGSLWTMADCAFPPPQLWGIRQITEIPWEIALAVGIVLRLFFAPLAEEIVMRGTLVPALERWSAPWVAPLVSSLVFCTLHFNYYLSPVDMAFVFWVGLVTAGMYCRTRAILVSFLFHVPVNLAMILHSLRAGCH